MARDISRPSTSGLSTTTALYGSGRCVIDSLVNTPPIERPQMQARDWGLANRVVPAAELIPASPKLAADMLTLVPECLSGYKRLIDQGYGESFADALQTELRLSAAANKTVRSAEIEARREAIRQRGQTQKI
jgi:hypothetical protein